MEWGGGLGEEEGVQMATPASGGCLDGGGEEEGGVSGE